MSYSPFVEAQGTSLGANKTIRRNSSQEYAEDGYTDPCLQRTQRSTESPPEGPQYSPWFHVPSACLHTLLRFFGLFPRLLRHTSRVRRLLKEWFLVLDFKQLKLLGVAFVLLAALRLRRHRLLHGGIYLGGPSKNGKKAALVKPEAISLSAASLKWQAARKKLTSAPEISFSEVLQLVASDKVEEVHYTPGSRVLLFLKDRRRLASTLVPGADTSFFRAVSTHVPRFRFVKVATFTDMLSFVFPLVLLCLWWGMLRSLLEPMRGRKDTGSNRGLDCVPPEAAFSDVVSTKKQELLEVVLVLNGEERYAAMGARLPRGVLLVGPSGTGKTLLARAVAGEARVPFLSAAASEFVEVYVGQGARRVREVFQAARRKAPCVLFIDELDALGSRWNPLGISSGHEEYVQTVNQFLMEMDGVCGGSCGVVVIGATNRLEAIDPALLRSGRFDRHIHLQLPSSQERHEILKLHAVSKKLRLEPGAWPHLQLVADAAEGLSGADLENLLNESVFRAVRRGRESIDPQALDDALLALLQRADRPTNLSV